MRVRNVHQRVLRAARSEVDALVAALGTDKDRLWPRADWPAQRFDRSPLTPGARGGHGPIRYRCVAADRGHLRFAFEPMTGLGAGLVGAHWFEVEAHADGALLRHVIEANVTGLARLTWPLAVRWLHDAVLEDLLDNAEAALGTRPARRARWSVWVRLLRLARPRALPRPRAARLTRLTVARHAAALVVGEPRSSASG